MRSQSGFALRTIFAARLKALRYGSQHEMRSNSIATRSKASRMSLAVSGSYLSRSSIGAFTVLSQALYALTGDLKTFFAQSLADCVSVSIIVKKVG